MGKSRASASMCVSVSSVNTRNKPEDSNRVLT